MIDLHEVTFSGSQRKLCIHLDGVRYTRPELASLFGKSATTIYRGLLDKTEEERLLYIQELLWRNKYNNGMTCRVYKRAGVWISGNIVAEKAEIQIQAAHKRCLLWERGVLTMEELIKPYRGSKENARNSSVTPVGILDDMPPRNPVSFLGKPGTWESGLPDPTDGMGTGTLGRGHGRNSSGIYYQGD